MTGSRGSPSVGFVPEVGRSPEFTFHSVRRGMHRGIPMGDQGIPIPRPQRHNAMNFMRMVGPEGLEPSTRDYEKPVLKLVFTLKLEITKKYFSFDFTELRPRWRGDAERNVDKLKIWCGFLTPNTERAPISRPFAVRCVVSGWSADPPY